MEVQEVELQQLIAERHVHQLLAQYAHALDDGEVDAFLGCFHPDALIEIRYPAHVVATSIPVRGGRTESERTLLYEGIDQLRGFAGAHTHAPEVLHKHAALMPLFDWQAADRVVVRSYTLRLDIGEDDVAFIRAFGRYTDLITRRDGAWKFLHRRADPQAMDFRGIRLFEPDHPPVLP